MKLILALLMIFLLIGLVILAVFMMKQAFDHRNDSYNYDRRRYGGMDESDRSRELEAYRRGLRDAGGSGSSQPGRGLRADGRPRRKL